MTKSKIESKKYKAALVIARDAGGDENQAHWESRLKAKLKRLPKPAGKPVRASKS